MCLELLRIPCHGTHLECTVCVLCWRWMNFWKVSWPCALHWKALRCSFCKHQLGTIPQPEAWRPCWVPVAQGIMFVHELSGSLSRGLRDSEEQCLASICLPEGSSGIAVEAISSLGLTLFVFSWSRVIVEIWLYLLQFLFESTPYKTINHCTAPETFLWQKPWSSVGLPTHLSRTSPVCHLSLSS